jgi:hypothetical protein
LAVLAKQAHDQQPGLIREMRRASPRICQTLLTGLMKGISTIRTSFQRNLPTKRRRNSTTNRVKKETRATLVDSLFDSAAPLGESNVSVVKYGVTALLIAEEIKPDILNIGLI